MFLMKKVRIERLELADVVVDVAGKAAVFEGLADGGIGRLVFRNLSVGGKTVVDSKKADIHWKNVGKVVVE